MKLSGSMCTVCAFGLRGCVSPLVARGGFKIGGGGATVRIAASLRTVWFSSGPFVYVPASRMKWTLPEFWSEYMNRCWLKVCVSLDNLWNSRPSLRSSRTSCHRRSRFVVITINTHTGDTIFLAFASGCVCACELRITTYEHWSTHDWRPVGLRSWVQLHVS